MDSKLLQQLAEVVEMGSLSQAAKKLNVTQPTLTRNMRIIEDRIGAPVLRRGRYGVTPTEIGEQLARQGRAIRAMVEQSKQTVAQWRTGLSGEIRIGVGPMLAASVMPGFYEDLLNANTSYSFRSVMAPAMVLLDYLNNGDLDVVIAPTQIRHYQESLYRTTIFPDQLAVFAGARSPLRDRTDFISVEELQAGRWMVVGAMSGIYDPLGDVLTEIGLGDIVPVFSFTGGVTIPIEILRRTDLLCVLPRRLMQFLSNFDGVSELKIAHELPDRDVALWVTNANYDRPDLIQFSEWAKRYFSELPAG